MLLLTPHAIVPAETLIDRLWDDRPPPKARESLSVYIARLRASLRAAVGDDVRLTGGTQGGYLLDVDPETVDVHQFRGLRRQAAARIGSGDHKQAAALLREADALWHGHALAGIRGEWAARTRDALGEERRAAVTERIGCELDLGRQSDLTGELHHLLTRYPLDETLVAHQMTALYRTGRHTDALALYRETRRRLADEQGIEPGEPLAQLHQGMLARDPALIARPARPPAPALTTLPADAHEFVGLPAAGGPEFAAAYRQLAPDHQRFLRRLAASPCATHTVWAAAALDGCTSLAAETSLGVLLDRHLLTTVDGHYRLDGRVRGYAAGRAQREDPPSGQQDAVSRLLGYYLDAADRADRLLHPLRRRENRSTTAVGPVFADREDAARWLESEWRNILQSASHAGRHEWKWQCADLSYLLAEFLEIRARWDEAISAHTLALQASRYLADPARIARAARALSMVSQQTGKHETAISLAEEAAAISRSLGDRGGEAESLDRIGLAHQRTAKSREALAYFTEARLLYQAAGDRRGVADALSHAGIACWHLGRYPEAHQQLGAALALYQDIGDRRGEAKVLNNLGRVHLHDGHHQEALGAYKKSLQIFREIGGPQNEAILCQAIGSVHRHRGSYEEALGAYRQALVIYRRIGDVPDEIDVLNDIGTIYQSAHCPDEALIHHGKAREIAEQIGDLSQQLTALRLVADIHQREGQAADALEHYQSALRLARQIGDPYQEGKILEGIAELTLYTQRRDTARIVLRQALDIFERLGVPDAEPAMLRMAALDPPFAARAD